VRFHNTGPDQIPGLIAMSIEDEEGAIDPQVKQVLVLLNASREPRELRLGAFRGSGFQLHPVQAASADPVVRGSGCDAETGTFRVPGRTAAVFWQRRPATAGLVSP
ncbi:MAG TPA: alpha-1,6-glucosidase domain-containing protein, partial [Thermoanaerobaculia bacterium]|nr:alpha-1,6-glucosidase domain-containing protein [Thermoanaerobaculia bacterium]